MRTLIKYLLFLALTLLFSCDKSGLLVKCPDCTIEEPTTAVLDIKVDALARVNDMSTVVRIYSGNLEDNILLRTSNVSDTYMKYTATINKKYTITATYITNDGSYIVVDSTTPRVKYVTSQCEEPCYFVYGRNVNLRLKYMK